MDLLGKEVLDLNGASIGIVKGVLFDEKAWQVVSFSVQLEDKTAKELEVKKLFQNYLISIDVAYVQGIGDKVTLKIDVDKLMTLLAAPEVPPTLTQ
jgi:sporulation protein YlmC with PRC-barrel domain